MNLRRSPTAARLGNALTLTLVLSGLMGLVLISYLRLVSNRHKVTARSQVWNSCIAIAEAGAEEALSHLNRNGVGWTNNLASNGWEPKDGKFYLKRSLDDCYYEVTIKPGVRPVITSTGYVPAHAQYGAVGGAFLAAKTQPTPAPVTSYISRTVQVEARAIGRWTKAIVARDKVELNGKYVIVDSYDSYDPNASTYNPTNPAQWGQYDISKRKDGGDVAVIAGLKDDLHVHGAKVWGKVSTGPEGDIKLDNKAVVGSLDWHAAGKTGVEPGWSTDDANFDMPQIDQPFNSGIHPTGGTVGTNTYDYILSDGDYSLSQLDGKVLVTGKARLLVTSKIEFKDGATDDDGIEFDPNARLEIYMKGKEAKLVGKKNKKKNPLSERVSFNDGGNATNFFYFGLEKNTKLDMKKMDEFVGMIYAPSAHITIHGGSPKYYKAHFYGSIQGFKVKMDKNATFHYDENIVNLGADSFVAESWKEL